MDVRRHLRNLLVRNELDVAVLSYQELVLEFSIQPLAAVAGNAEKEAIGPAAGSQIERARLEVGPSERNAISGRAAVEVR
jgi:hypothetical protein